jgi:hypothetical protein
MWCVLYDQRKSVLIFYGVITHVWWPLWNIRNMLTFGKKLLDHPTDLFLRVNQHPTDAVDKREGV